MQVADEVMKDIQLALGTENVPVLLSEKQVEQIGLRSAVSLRRDRCKGKYGGNSYLPFIKDPKGRIKYKTVDVVAAMTNGLKVPPVVDEE